MKMENTSPDIIDSEAIRPDQLHLIGKKRERTKSEISENEFQI
jgi:hypothetical protein